ncbi:MAG: hypothetical protein WKF84_06000 [Pyrinomonadaceae bacterium]
MSRSGSCISSRRRRGGSRGSSSSSSRSSGLARGVRLGVLLKPGDINGRGGALFFLRDEPLGSCAEWFTA